MVEVCGHRGCAGIEPENTMRGFKKAIESGAEYVGADVRMTKDKELVLIHDSSVDRTTNGHGPVRSYEMKELLTLDAGRNERIPNLLELYYLMKQTGIKVELEIKEPDTVKSIISFVRKQKISDMVILSSLWHDILKGIKEKHPGLVTGAVLLCRPVDPVSLAKDCGVDYLLMNCEYVDEDLVYECHSNDIRLIVNADFPEDILRMIRLGVDMINTDYPDIAVEIRERLRKPR
ncbi:MAG: hypothetical protein JW754_05805 [Candidatus Aenigmarchaeota archaeon]|nr:hypothetical protein [Candidatus Aenigmarchaeota archaeon]